MLNQCRGACNILKVTVLYPHVSDFSGTSAVAMVDGMIDYHSSSDSCSDCQHQRMCSAPSSSKHRFPQSCGIYIILHPAGHMKASFQQLLKRQAGILWNIIVGILNTPLLCVYHTCCWNSNTFNILLLHSLCNQRFNALQDAWSLQYSGITADLILHHKHRLPLP